MIVHCSLKLSKLIRKAVETMHMGSEEATFFFQRHKLKLQSIDASGNCVCTFDFNHRRFHKYVVADEKAIKISLSVLHKFFKDRSNAVYSMKLEANGLWIESTPTASNKGASQVQRLPTFRGEERIDILPMRIDEYRESPCFNLDPTTFNKMVLDLAVDAGCVEIEFKGRVCTWRNRFETGEVVLTLAEQGVNNKYRVVKAASAPVRFKYYTKFFKQACNIEPNCVNLTVYLRSDGPCVLHFQLENENPTMVMTVFPVTSVHRRRR